MNLQTHLAVRTPCVWVTTDEATRVLDAVILHSKRPVYRMDPLKGFCHWSDGKWIQMLVGEGPGMAPTGDLNEAMPIVAAAGGTLVVEHAHELPLDRLISSFNERFRYSVLHDDAQQLPAQLILCSHKDEVSPAVNRIIAKTVVDLPSADELTVLATKVVCNAAIDDKLEPDTLMKTGRAATGLSESEAINTFLASLTNTSTMDVEFIGRAKLDSMKQGGLLEVRSPKVSLADVGGLDRAKSLFESVSWLWQHPKEAAEFDVIPPRRILLIGLQGGGKSLVAEATAASLGLDLAKGGISNAMNKFIGESEANMRRMFRQVKAMAPIVFWVDEFGRDASGGASSSEVDGGTTDRVHGEFLSGIQELPEDVFLLAAANRIDHLPPEMTRADRFDKIMFVGFPSLLEREEIFKIHLGTHWERYNLSQLAEATPFYTGAEIKALIRDTRFTVAASEHRVTETADLLDAAPLLKARAWNRHREEIVTMYERARGEWDWASSAQEEEADEILKAAKRASVESFTPKHHLPAKEFNPANFDG
jgi:ATP-dependent 26S proteasome regulatory subunit